MLHALLYYLAICFVHHYHTLFVQIIVSYAKVLCFSNNNYCMMVMFIIIMLVTLLIEECSDFKAGNALRSASRFHKLDETALFGSACRHEMPLYFFNLKHGEMYNDEL